MIYHYELLLKPSDESKAYYIMSAAVYIFLNIQLLVKYIPNIKLDNWYI